MLTKAVLIIRFSKGLHQSSQVPKPARGCSLTIRTFGGGSPGKASGQERRPCWKSPPPFGGAIFFSDAPPTSQLIADLPWVDDGTNTVSTMIFCALD